MSRIRIDEDFITLRMLIYWNRISLIIKSVIIFDFELTRAIIDYRLSDYSVVRMTKTKLMIVNMILL